MCCDFLTSPCDHLYTLPWYDIARQRSMACRQFLFTIFCSCWLIAILEFCKFLSLRFSVFRLSIECTISTLHNFSVCACRRDKRAHQHPGSKENTHKTQMNGISLSKRDKLLICLATSIPPLATYLKFGKSRTLVTNCLFTMCLFIPGVIHAIKAIYDYPSVVFRGKEETKDGITARDDSVIWEIPRDHFQSISGSIRVLEAQSLSMKNSNDPMQKSSTTSLLQMSKCKSNLTASSTIAASGKGSYFAHVDGNAPLLNPNYGWGIIATKEITTLSSALRGVDRLPKADVALETRATQIANTQQVQQSNLEHPPAKILSKVDVIECMLPK